MVYLHVFCPIYKYYEFQLLSFTKVKLSNHITSKFYYDTCLNRCTKHFFKCDFPDLFVRLDTYSTFVNTYYLYMQNLH